MRPSISEVASSRNWPCTPPAASLQAGAAGVASPPSVEKGAALVFCGRV